MRELCQIQDPPPALRNVSSTFWTCFCQNRAKTNYKNAVGKSDFPLVPSLRRSKRVKSNPQPAYSDVRFLLLKIWKIRKIRNLVFSRKLCEAQRRSVSRDRRKEPVKRSASASRVAFPLFFLVLEHLIFENSEKYSNFKRTSEAKTRSIEHGQPQNHCCLEAHQWRRSRSRRTRKRSCCSNHFPKKERKLVKYNSFSKFKFFKFCFLKVVWESATRLPKKSPARRRPSLIFRVCFLCFNTFPHFCVHKRPLPLQKKTLKAGKVTLSGNPGAQSDVEYYGFVVHTYRLFVDLFWKTKEKLHNFSASVHFWTWVTSFAFI